jgi:uncharacterized membrane protein YgcG
LKTELQALLRETEQQTGAEIALVTVPSLDGATVEQYANTLFKEWGIGKKGLDNGVLVLVAPAERKVRIEVGYGLERYYCGVTIRPDVSNRRKFKYLVAHVVELEFPGFGGQELASG